MKERGMIFQGWGVRAVLADIKTMTRRLPVEKYLKWKKGDLIYVKETYFTHADLEVGDIWYKSDEDQLDKDDLNFIKENGGWKPSIFMPRWAARFILEMTEDAHAERLQKITEEDAEREGMVKNAIDHTGYINISPTYRRDFSRVWEQINGKGSWSDNPEVAVIEFRRVK